MTQSGFERSSVGSPVMKLGTSNRLAMLRFPAILGVLFIHSATTTMHTAEGTLGATHSAPLVDAVKYFISKEVAAPAVPILFLMSGYLFFEGFRPSWSAYGKKLRRRVDTLLIPFLFWNGATLLLYLVGENLPATRNYFLGNPQWPQIANFQWTDYLRAFGIGGIYPIAYQFWYVRDLMAMVLLVPFFSAILTGRAALPFLALTFAMWVGNFTPTAWPTAGVVFFFLLGGYLSSAKIDICALDPPGKWIVLLGFLPLAAFDLALRGSAEHDLVHKALILIGIANVWWLTGIAQRHAGMESWLIRQGSASFFVFSAHEPLLMICRRLSLKVLARHSDSAALLFFVLMPVLIAGLLVMVYRGLGRLAPGFLAVITGGRESFRPGGGEALSKATAGAVGSAGK